MDRKTITQMAVATAVVLVAVGGIADLTRDDQPRQNAAMLAQQSGPPLAECTAAREALGRVVGASPDRLSNPRAGVLLLPPVFWGSLGETERTNLLTMLAVQKGCATNTRAAQVSVELRSSSDNRLLGSGPAWNFEEAN